MRVVALGQAKGGVGKSAVAINLACQAVAAGESAVIVDMDAEQGTALSWGKRREGRAPAVLPADTSTLPGVLGKLSRQKWVFLDLPGRHAPISSAGLVASDLILIPCRPLDVDIEASAPTVHAAVRAGKRYAYLMNIAVTQHDKRRARVVSEKLAEAGYPVCPVIISSRMMVPVSLARGQGVGEMFPDSDSSQEFTELFQWLRRTVK